MVTYYLWYHCPFLDSWGFCLCPWVVEYINSIMISILFLIEVNIHIRPMFIVFASQGRLGGITSNYICQIF